MLKWIRTKEWQNGRWESKSIILSRTEGFHVQPKSTSLQATQVNRGILFTVITVYECGRMKGKYRRCRYARKMQHPKHNIENSTSNRRSHHFKQLTSLEKCVGYVRSDKERKHKMEGKNLYFIILSRNREDSTSNLTALHFKQTDSNN